MSYKLRYRYNGPARRFGELIGNFSGVTEVPENSPNPERRALNNLTYRCKKDYKLDRTALLKLDASKLEFVGKVFTYK